MLAAVIAVIAYISYGNSEKETVVNPVPTDTTSITTQQPDSITTIPQQQPANTQNQQPAAPVQTQPQPVQTQQTTTQPAPAAPVVTTGTLSLNYGSYKGEIKSKRPHGEGSIYFNRSHTYYDTPVEPGYRLEGTFENGQLIIGKLYGADGSKLQTIMP